MPARRPWLRGLTVLAAALAVLLLIAVGMLSLGSVSVDAQRFLAPIDTALTRVLGREVEIGGPARLSLSWNPSLVVHDVRVDNPAGFAEPLFGTVAQLRLDSELLPLLRKQLIVRELRASGVAVRLARSAQGRGNWLFQAEPRPAGEQPRLQFEFDWRRLVFERAVVEFALAGKARSVQLDSLVLEGLTGLPLQFEAQGQADGRLALQAEAGSAPLSALAGPEPWPFSMALQAPQTTFGVSGARLPGAAGPAVRLQLEVSTRDADELGELLGISLPAGGAGALAGELELSPGLALLRNLDAELAGTRATGELSLDSRGPRRRISGHLSAPQFDLLSAAAPGSGAQEAPATLAALYAMLSEAEVLVDRYTQLDLDLGLNIGRVINAPGDLSDVSVTVQADAGRLRMPLRAMLGDAPIRAELSADITGRLPRFGLNFAAEDAPFGGLAMLLFDLPYMAGTVRRFDGSFSAGGRTLAELVADLEVRAVIEGAQLSYGHYPGGRPVALEIGTAQLSQQPGKALTATVNGSLRGKVFEGAFNADTLGYLLRERQTPFTFTGTSAGTRLRLSGTLAEPGPDGGPDIEFALSAPQARELAPWLGFSSQSTARVTMDGRILVQDTGVTLVGGSLVFGRSSIQGDLDWRRSAGKARVTAKLAAELLAPAELRGLRGRPVSALQRTLIDLPVLPETLDFGDADLELTVKRIDGLALDITDLVFSGRLRDGAVEPSPFALKLQGSELTGSLALDTRGALPVAELSLEGDDFDAGAVLRRLPLARAAEGRISKLRLELTARGSRLGEMLAHSTVRASLEAGTLSYRDAGSQSLMSLTLSEGELRADAGGAMTGFINGSAGTFPTRLEIDTGPLSELLAPAGRWPFSVAAKLADALWILSGTTIAGPMPAAELTLSLSGERLSDLDVLLATSLPPWGPYAAAGRLSFAGSAYQVEDLEVAIGSSLLRGFGLLDTGSTPPRLDATLVAPLIQLDDFPLTGWSLLPGAEPVGPMTSASVRRALASGVDRVYPLFSRERLAVGDAQVTVRIERMLSGEDVLGSGRFDANVVDGAATLGPFEMYGPAGRGSILIGYEPRELEAVFSADILIDRLDYGMVAARFDPDTELAGTFSLDMVIDGVTPDLQQLLAYSSGHADLVVWPDRLRWAGFDLWAANLLRSLLPFFSPVESHINCVIGHFDLNQGLLGSQTLLIDTTNTRTPGTAVADFGSGRLHMRFVPSHKRPRLFSIAIPVEVRGTFDDYRIALRPTDAVGRVGHWFKSLAMVPLHWLGVGRIPRDGRDVCTDTGRS